MAKSRKRKAPSKNAKTAEKSKSSKKTQKSKNVKRAKIEPTKSKKKKSKNTKVGKEKNDYASLFQNSVGNDIEQRIR